jgi:hypothetical protein
MIFKIIEDKIKVIKPRKKATNVAVDYLENYAENILSEEWTRNRFDRSYIIQQSFISKFFFNEILKIEEEGFYTIPSKKIIKEQLFKKFNNQ